MKYFNKKSVALIFVILTIFLVAPKPIFAAGPVFEVNPLTWLSNQVSAVATKLGASAAVATKVQQVAEWVFKLANEVLKRQFLDRIVNQTVKSIQGGETPQFITNWPAFFRDAVDQAGGQFIQQIGLSQLCSSFKPVLKIALEPVPTFNERTTCTLNKVVDNIKDTLGYFKSGNWIAWNQMVSEPQNNVYGAYVMAWDQYEIEKAAAAEAAKSQAQASKGFLDQKKCVEYNAEATNDCLGKVSGSNTEADLERCKKAGCTKWETVTPGDTVGAAVAKAVGSDFDFIVNSDDLKRYASAITNALSNRIFKEGLSKVSTTLSSFGYTGVTEEGVGAPPDIQTQCAQFSVGTADYDNCKTATLKCSQFWGTGAYDDCMAAMIQSGADIETFRRDHLTSLIDLDLNYQDQLLGAKRDVFLVLNQTLGTLGDLGSCLASECPNLTQVQDASTTLDIINQIGNIQLRITALKIRLHAAEKKLKDIKENEFLGGLFDPNKANLKNEIKALKAAIVSGNTMLYCLNLSIDPDPDLAKVLSMASTTADILNQIKKIQHDILDITALKITLQKAKDGQETIDVVSLGKQISEAKSSIPDTQNEITKKQQDLSSYQQRFGVCQQIEQQESGD